MSLQKAEIYFWMVRDGAEKLSTVCQLVARHFARKERVVIATPSIAVAQYVDQLLWSLPPESFLPHAISEVPLEAAVVITVGDQNPNQATVLVNLCGGPTVLIERITCLHELYDQSDPEKRARFAEALCNLRSGWLSLL